jgi:hypothetical protein
VGGFLLDHFITDMEDAEIEVVNTEHSKCVEEPTLIVSSPARDLPDSQGRNRLFELFHSSRSEGKRFIRG